MRYLAFLFAVTIILPFQTALASETAVPILDFHQVSQNIYRGARPHKIGLEALAKMGFKTILNIDNDKVANLEESQNAQALGLRMVSIPMSGFWAPTDAQVEKVLAELTNAENSPIFIHCKHGHDRTGLIVGLYRIEFEQWTPAQAYAEMLNLGFHKELVFLNHYFEQKTGFED